MECLHQPIDTGRMGTYIAKFDSEKITQIREKIKVVFESECLLDDVTISEKYNISGEGDLIMILR
jgi:ABC-type lipoprotein export system ATPase subunit